MDNSSADSDVSLSPSQILEKLELLRQVQLMQRGKLLKQRLDYQNSHEVSSSITEIVSHFSNSTTYNTFRSLLQSSRDSSQDATPRRQLITASESSHKNNYIDHEIEGVSMLNSSQESERLQEVPAENQSIEPNIDEMCNASANKSSSDKVAFRKQISLDEMPILSPKQNFEELVSERLKMEQPKTIPPQKQTMNGKKKFLKKGEGMARFGIKKNDLIIQNTKSLPWRKKSSGLITKCKPIETKSLKGNAKNDKLIKVHIVTPEIKKAESPVHTINESHNAADSKKLTTYRPISPSNQITNNDYCNSPTSLQTANIRELHLKPKKLEHPLKTNKTWAAVLTKEQDDFLRQLKQSEYYKNFSSPSKSVISDVSYSESVSQATQYKELAEQHLFDLIENKVSNESFNVNNSFFNKFLKSKLDGSGESTPLVMQKCLSQNPNLLNIAPDISIPKRNVMYCSDVETCISECTDCSECCSVLTCCSCPSTNNVSNVSTTTPNKKNKKCTVTISQTNRKEDNNKKLNENCHKDSNEEVVTDTANANMAEMNAQLVATSELLKERLKELEDEIETFRKENANINKMREEIDLERQKFYEEKSTFEKKFNEEKILSEYYLAEEKEKLAKQKQTYERYVRDIRGRLNKKEKDEVVNLKKDINDLKEEMRVKDAKSTSTIARLRNQLKIMEKEKKALENEVEALKKENRRIQHSNDVTRRLTNIKYLEQINQKLSNMTAKETKSDVGLDSNIKYKAFEIERQNIVSKTRGTRSRAKSVPNLNVTSKYAKYFSQKDSVSDKDITNSNKTYSNSTHNHEEPIENWYKKDDCGETLNNDDDYLEKMYNDKFKSNSPCSNRSSGTSLSDSPPQHNNIVNKSGFFLQKSNSNSSCKRSMSPLHLTPNSSCSNISTSNSILNEKPQNPYIIQSNTSRNQINNRIKSPTSNFSNHSSVSQKATTVIHTNDQRMMLTPELIASSLSLTKTHLQPVETLKPNGTRELRFPNGNVKIISADGKYSKFIYYNGDIKENFYEEGRVKYFYAESKTYHTTFPDGLEVLEFPDGQIEKRYKDGSSEIRLPNGMMRYYDPKNDLTREEWRYPDGTTLTVSADGEQRIIFPNGQIEVHAKDHKRREFPDGTTKLVYNDGTSETRYASGRIRIKDKHGNLIMDSAWKN